MFTAVSMVAILGNITRYCRPEWRVSNFVFLFFHCRVTFSLILIHPLLHIYLSKMSSTGTIDKRSDGRVTDRMENYTKFWNTDPLKEENADNAKRLDSYTDVVNGQLLL